MDYIIVRIGGKGFKSYYFPVANFLEARNNVKVVALGKRVQMAAYLCSIIQKHGARIDNIRLSTVELPPSEMNNDEKKIVDVVMLEIFLSRAGFIAQVKPDKQNYN